MTPTSPAPRAEGPLPATTQGVATAAVERQQAVVDCLMAEEDAGRPFVGRPTLRVSVWDDEGVGAIEVTLAGGTTHRPEAEACLAEAFADAQFAAPPVDHTVVWPVPF